MAFWAIDTHVHISGHATLPASTLDTISATFEGESAALGVMLLADMPDQDGVETLLRSNQHSRERQWTRQQDCGTPYVVSEGLLPRLAAIRGFQVVTREGLEVLGLMMAERPSDGGALGDTIDEIVAAGGLPVLPWGVGKWLGRRGRLVLDVISQPRWRGALALADNGNRPGLWPQPRLLKRARSAEFAVLHGTDPLPLGNEPLRIGSAGVIVPAGPIDTPVAFLRRVLREPLGLRTYGSPMSIGGFLYRQTAIRLRAAS